MARQVVLPEELWMRKLSGGSVTFIPANRNVKLGIVIGTGTNEMIDDLPESMMVPAPVAGSKVKEPGGMLTSPRPTLIPIRLTSDNGPRPSPNRPCGGTELPVALRMQPKVYPATESAARVTVSCERFAAMAEEEGQPTQPEQGTQAASLLVSMANSKVCGGVPMLALTMYVGLWVICRAEAIGTLDFLATRLSRYSSRASSLVCIWSTVSSHESEDLAGLNGEQEL
nr:hypothetical protein MtrunA17_Chr1g0164411 [Ipomoea batatas]